jgi:ribosomal protein S18 acetylase RimI-like enzyme
VIRAIRVDDATIRALERHETFAHAIPDREVRDLGDSIVLFDERDPDPFWNRMTSMRWPAEAAAFDHRLTETVALFAIRGRQPHLWPSPDHSQPPDLVARLVANGFVDVGGGHVMVLDRPEECRPVTAHGLPPQVTMESFRGGALTSEAVVSDIARVLAESFGVMPGRETELATDLARALHNPRVSLALARFDGEPAAVAKATTFDGMTYLSSIGTRSAFRGRGLGSLVTRQAVAIGAGPGRRLTYLGVFSGNEPALRMYARLGFATLGEAPDLLFK